MKVLDNSTRRRVVGSTTAFAAGGTALGGAVATIIHELALPNLTANGALALGVVCSAVLAILGGWAAPSKKAETEAYLGSVLAMAQYGNHGRLSPVAQKMPAIPGPVSDLESTSDTSVADEVPPGYELVDTAGTEYSNPAYALGK